MLSLKKSRILRTIVKIKPGFDAWVRHGWNETQLYKGALARWERFNHIKNKRDAILIFFTWRKIKKKNFLSSTFYKKIMSYYQMKILLII